MNGVNYFFMTACPVDRDSDLKGSQKEASHGVIEACRVDCWGDVAGVSEVDRTIRSNDKVICVMDGAQLCALLV